MSLTEKFDTTFGDNIIKPVFNITLKTRIEKYKFMG